MKDQFLNGLDSQPGEKNLPRRSNTLDILTALREKVFTFNGFIHKLLAISSYIA